MKDITDYLINREDSIEYKTNNKIENLKSLLYADNITIHGKKELVKCYEDEILRQKQINEEHRKINAELREKVKELEKENRMFKDNKVLVSRYFKLKDNSIPKQKIKDKIEEIEKEENLYAKTNIIRVLQELLQESEDK